MTRTTITRLAHETGAAPWLVWTDFGPVLRDEHGDEPLRLGSLAELETQLRGWVDSCRVHRLVSGIHDRRKQLGLTQAEAAERAGITQGAWSHAERGYREPRLDLLERMAAAVGLRVELVDDT